MSEAVNVELIAGSDQGEKIITGISVHDIGATMQKFGWLDYIVFVMMLMICIVVGIYYGLCKSTASSQDYLVGGRTMKIFPISMSLIASFISGISLLGIPTEIYIYGIQYVYIGCGIILMALVMENVYLPVFHDLQLTSTYELIWLPVVIYVPALAFNQVTGLNVHWITPAVCAICIFYTSLGGIRAVVMTDIIQTIIMFGAIFLVIIKGTLDVGGTSVVWNRNWESNRIEGPNFDINPLSRHTIWSLTIGGFVYCLQTSAVNQNMIQRYLSLPNLNAAKKSLWLFVFGVLFIIGLSAYSGMLIYATYYKCDPLTTRLVREKDQLLPLLVMEVLGDYPGLPGLFVAGIFSAALSSLSTGLNSMAAIILEDCYKSFFRKNLSKKHTFILMKSTVIVMGTICVGLVFIVEKLGAVLQLTMSIGAIANGPSLGLFTMGILLPWINAKGALIGTITSLLFMSWLTISAQTAITKGNMLFPEKPVSTLGCNYHFTPKLSLNIRLDPLLNATNIDEVFMLYRLSYLWYTLLGALVSMIVALVVSFLTKPLDPRDVDPKLLAPFVRLSIPSRKYKNQPQDDGIIYAFQKVTETNSQRIGIINNSPV